MKPYPAIPAIHCYNGPSGQSTSPRSNTRRTTASTPSNMLDIDTSFLKKLNVTERHYFHAYSFTRETKRTL